jgi:putative endonuclease
MTALTHWFVYMIRTSDAQVYTGITTDMARRWREHESGKTGARYFRGRKPVQLCYLEADHNRSTASQREYAIKSLSASAKKQLIAEQQTQTLALIGLHQLEQLPH